MKECPNCSSAPIFIYNQENGELSGDCCECGKRFIFKNYYNND